MLFVIFFGVIGAGAYPICLAAGVVDLVPWHNFAVFWDLPLTHN